MTTSTTERDKGFSALMKKYGRDLYWFIRRIVVDHDDAEDVLQETTIKVLSGINGFRGDSSLRTWLYTIAGHEALQFLRGKKSFFKSLDSIGEDLVEKLESQSDLDGEHAQMLFQRALLRLPTRQRVAFNLRYYDELPYEEISHITGSSVSTLKSNYHYAVKKIELYLRENM